MFRKKKVELQLGDFMYLRAYLYGFRDYGIILCTLRLIVVQDIGDM